MKKIIGSKHLCNNASILIIDVLYGIEDKIVWKYSFENKIHKSKLYTTTTDRSYFLINGRREYLEEYIRTDIF
jgi:hypothetical protein